MSYIRDCINKLKSRETVCKYILFIDDIQSVTGDKTLPIFLPILYSKRKFFGYKNNLIIPFTYVFYKTERINSNRCTLNPFTTSFKRR